MWKNPHRSAIVGPLYVMLTQRMGGRVAEGAPLLREYTVMSRIAGSNPAPSANYLTQLHTTIYRNQDQGPADQINQASES